MKNSLAVWTGGTQSGLLEQEEISVFNYLPGITENLAVSLTMPIRLQSWTSRTLHPVFQMNLPEGALLRTIKNALSKVARVDDLALLRVAGTNQIGRNRFALPDEPYPWHETTPESLSDILSYPDAGALFTELLGKYALRSGISGIQPKVMLNAKERATAYSSSYIVKSWGDDYPHLGANEYFCMVSARKAGLPVPDFYLSDDGKLFVMKRFDISGQGDYLGFEDMCVLQGMGTEDKYRGSYERILKSIGDYVSPSRRQEARRQFFTTLVLSLVVRNGDAHLKNFGVLYDDPAKGEIALAPVYDIVTTTAYIEKDVPALTLNGTKKWWDRKAIEKFGVTHCNLPAADISGIIEMVVDAVQDTRKEIKSHYKDLPEFRETGDRMLKAWEEGLLLR